MATNTLYAQFETVRKEMMPDWQTKRFGIALDFVQKGEVEQVNERDFRIPFNTTFGGRAGKYDPQLGDMGRGSSGTGDVMIGSYFNMRLNFELDFLKLKANKPGVSKLKPLARLMAEGFQEFKMYRDKWFHGTGTATIGQATAHTTSSGRSVYTMDTNFGANRLRRGQYVTVYDTTLATQAATNIYIYSMALNGATHTVTLSATVSGAAATDKFTFEGVSGASPTGLRGLYYWNDDAASGTTAGINRALEPEILANSVDATGGLTPEHGMALYHRILVRRGSDVNGLLGLCPVAQQAAIWSNVMSIQNMDISKGVPSSVNRLPALKGKKSFEWCGIPHWIDVHQNQTRIDYIDPKTWGKAQLDKEDFFKLPTSGQYIFPLYGGSGAPAAGLWFGMTCDEDYYNSNPGANGFIKSCPLGTLYGG